jgi:hypothetical protein
MSSVKTLHPGRGCRQRQKTNLAFEVSLNRPPRTMVRSGMRTAMIPSFSVPSWRCGANRTRSSAAISTTCVQALGRGLKAGPHKVRPFLLLNELPVKGLSKPSFTIAQFSPALYGY